MVDEPSNGNGTASPSFNHVLPTELSEPNTSQVELRSTAASALLERLLLARQAGLTHTGQRDLYAVLGYERIITAQQYRDRYARGGIAARVVDALPRAVWRGDGQLFEEEDPEVETQFETQWKALNNQLRVWSTLERAHVLACLSSFSVLLLGAPGELDVELPRGKPGGLFYLSPYAGGIVNNTRGASSAVGADVTVSTWDENSSSPRFGQPLTYQIRRTNMTAPSLQRPVHWSRLVHIPAPGFLDDAVFGPPALEVVWNYLDDLEKVVGGGAEAFWLRANQGIHLNIDKKMALSAVQDSVESLKEQADLYAHQMTRMIRTRGVDINTLGSDVADFKSPADAIVTLIAGATGIPKRILTGSEMGQLASEQDRDNWNDQIRDERTSYAHPIILRPFIERLIAYGYLNEPEQWEPEWPDVEAMNETEKLDAAEKAAKLNAHGQIIITSEEIRETYLGREPLEEDVVEEEEVDGEEEEEEDDDDDDDEDDDDTEEQVDRLEAAIRKGNVDIVVRTAHAAAAPTPAPEPATIIVNPSAVPVAPLFDSRIEYDEHGRAARIVRELKKGSS